VVTLTDGFGAHQLHEAGTEHAQGHREADPREVFGPGVIGQVAVQPHPTAVTHHDSFVDHVADVSDENAQEGQKEPFFCKMSEENLPQVGDGFDEPG
jgi:hypothetical protein